MQLLNQPLLFRRGEPVEAGIAAQHPFLVLSGKIAVLVEPILQVAGGCIALTLIPAIDGTCVIGAGVRLAGIGRTYLPWGVALRLARILLPGELLCGPSRIGPARISRTLPRLRPTWHLRARPRAALRPDRLRADGLGTRRGGSRSRLGATLAASPQRGRAQSHKQSGNGRAACVSPTSRIVSPCHKRLPSLSSQLIQSRYCCSRKAPPTGREPGRCYPSSANREPRRSVQQAPVFRSNR